ncbi:MAG: hypothetical protein CL605_03620 [Altibacter sp.]|uniref:hypothetical protein n=1 Tax=Altibacter sp. TaxID=2024823 RepID=UPI000C92C435|nr:hypothetical protein [Altibacter sp.]MAP53970.1 hypothetical protein [Altibacter sp.]
MSKFLRDGFETAIMRDMSPEMNDEEGMFHLFIYELVAETAKHVIDMTVMEELTSKLMDSLMEAAIDSELRRFQDKHA